MRKIAVFDIPEIWPQTPLVSISDDRIVIKTHRRPHTWITFAYAASPAKSRNFDKPPFVAVFISLAVLSRILINIVHARWLMCLLGRTAVQLTQNPCNVKFGFYGDFVTNTRANNQQTSNSGELQLCSLVVNVIIREHLYSAWYWPARRCGNPESPVLCKTIIHNTNGSMLR